VSRDENPSRRSLPVFAADGRIWTIGEVLAVAEHIRDATREPELPARGLPQSGKAGDLDAAVQAYRYQHDLVSAEECLNWLTARGLSYADLRASIARRLAATPAPSAAAEQIDLILSDEFARLARALAARVAVAVQAGAAVTGSVYECWAQLEARFRAFATAAADPPARQRQLHNDRLNWVQVEFEQVEFDSLDAAREARLCVLEDGQSLRELALAGRLAHVSRCSRVSVLPPAWSHALLRTRPGTITPVISDGERLLVLAVTRIIEPSLSDPSVVSGIDTELLEQQLEPLLARHVRWDLNGIA
jgi:hypothetical protein